MHRHPGFRDLLRITLLFGLASCADAQEGGEPSVALTQEATPTTDDQDPTESVDPPGLSGPRDMDGSGCTLPPDCKDVRTPGLNLNVCCTKKLACGIDMKPMIDGLLDPNNGISTIFIREVIRATLPPGTDLKRPCLTPTSLWMPSPSLPDQRVYATPERDIVLAEKCPSLMLSGFPVYGCCMPDNKCGLSTHYVLSDMRMLSSTPEKIGPAQCTTAAGVTEMVKNTNISQFTPLPTPRATSCDYAKLYASLPKAELPSE